MSRSIWFVLLLFYLQVVFTAVTKAQPEGFKGFVAGEKPEVLFQPGQGGDQPVVLSKKSKLANLEDLQLTGPKPSHPFVLGNFSSDGHWGMSGGFLQPIDGKNSALQLAWADRFVLDGTLEVTGMGGWFILVGWNQGRGYAISNVTMRESGSPWFVSEFRGNNAIDGHTQELEKFEWKGEQPFKLKVEGKAFSLDVGKFHVFDAQPLSEYAPGRVAIGVYDTRYGPRPLRIRALRIQALPAAIGETSSAAKKGM